jgi:hypothetical protein
VTVTNDVKTPTVTVKNDVKTPTVNVKNDVKPSEVIVTAPVKAEVTVNPEMRIVSMPDRVTKREVKRTPKGVITETIELETDG